MSTAFVVDGAYFLRRLRWSFPAIDAKHPVAITDALWRLVLWHLEHRSDFVAEQSGRPDNPTRPKVPACIAYSSMTVRR